MRRVKRFNTSFVRVVSIIDESISGIHVGPMGIPMEMGSITL